MSHPDAKTARRLRRAVEHAENYRRDLTGPHRQAAPSGTGFWAEITGDESGATSGPTGYSWKKIQSDGAGGLEDAPGTIDARGSAFNVNGGLAALGDRVWLRFAGYVEKEPIYLFGAVGAGMAQITAMASDYLTVQLVDTNGTPQGSDTEVAKPPKLRHDYSLYPGLTSFTTTNTNKGDAGDGTTTETWAVTPIYSVGDLVAINRVRYSGVSAGGADLKWIDANLDGRAWAKRE